MFSLNLLLVLQKPNLFWQLGWWISGKKKLWLDHILEHLNFPNKWEKLQLNIICVHRDGWCLTSLIQIVGIWQLGTTFNTNSNCAKKDWRDLNISDRNFPLYNSDYRMTETMPGTLLITIWHTKHKSFKNLMHFWGSYTICSCISYML